MSSNGTRIQKRLSELKSKRQPHEQSWRDCYQHTFPLRADGFDGQQLDAQQGQNQRARILDSTGTDSCRTLASAIMSGLTPANSRWFELDVDNEDEEEKRYLDSAADTIWLNIHQSNFDAEAFECSLDAVAAGWFVLYIDEDRENGGYSFEQWAISGCYVASSRSDGLVDIVYREYKLTAEQAAQKFGADNLSENTRKLSTAKPDQLVNFIHAIEPRSPHVVGARLARNLPFASCHVEQDSGHIVRESGYHEFPCVVPRWMRIPNSCYGVGPAYDALPDMRMLNELKAFSLSAADVAIAGMWIAEDDGVLNPRTMRIGPRKIIVANSVDSMKPLTTGSNFELAEHMVAQLQAAIRKILMADQLQPQDGPAMTATEVHVRVELIRQLLGPIYGRFQAEYLRPLVQRCFGIAYRAGVLGVAPESLQGREFSVKYVSPMARAQRLEEVTAIERLFASAASFAQATGDASIFDRFNFDEAIRATADGLGVPDKVLLSSDELQAKLDAKEQARQQAQQAQSAAQTMQVASDAAAVQAAQQAAA